MYKYKKKITLIYKKNHMSLIVSEYKSRFPISCIYEALPLQTFMNYDPSSLIVIVFLFSPSVLSTTAKALLILVLRSSGDVGIA